MPVETIEDHHIKIKPSSRLINFIEKNLRCKDIPENFNTLKKSSNNKCGSFLLSLSDIKWLKSYIVDNQSTFSENIYLHELLEGVDVKLPEPKITPRNPELEARIQKLQAQQDARDYKEMTKGVDSYRKHLPEDTIAYQMKVINKQLIAVAQFIFSVIAGFTFGFKGVDLIIGNLDFGFRLLLGIMCALVIALAEIYFLAKKLNEDYEEVSPAGVSKKEHQD